MSVASITVPRRELSAALARLAITVPKRCPREALTFARLSLSDRLELVGTDCDIAHSEHVDAETAAGGVVTLVNVDELKRVAAASKASTATIDVDNSGAVSVDGFELGARPTLAEFPMRYLSHAFDDDGSTAAGLETIGGAIVNAEEFRRLVTLAEFATDNESSRYALGGCLLEAEPDDMGNWLRVVGADGRRLTVAETSNAAAQCSRHCDASGRAVAFEPSSAIVPASTCKLLLKQLGKRTKAVHVVVELLRNVRPVPVEAETSNAANATPATPPSSVRDNRADVVRVGLFNAAGCLVSLVTSRCVEGRYPNWRAVVSDDNAAGGFRGVVDVVELGAAVKRVGITTDKDARGVKFGFRPRKMFIHNRGMNGRRVNVAVGLRDAITFDYASCRVTLDCDYVAQLAKAAAAAGVNSVELYATRKDKPVRVVIGNALHIIAPMAR